MPNSYVHDKKSNTYKIDLFCWATHKKDLLQRHKKLHPIIIVRLSADRKSQQLLNDRVFKFKWLKTLQYL